MVQPIEPIKPKKARRAHLIGARGAGMRSLARALRDEGWNVTGSDQSPTGSASGVQAGHSPHHVPSDVDLVVASDAVPLENCERQRAADLGVPPISYAEMLGRLSRERFTLAVAGTHGKSTTSAMTSHILKVAGMNPTAIFGAEMMPVHPDLAATVESSPAPFSSSPISSSPTERPMIVEACEYRRNFLNLRPDIAVITGIEHDHFECFPTPDSSKQAFSQFAQNTDSSGLLLASGDCPATLDATSRADCQRQTFGFARLCDWQATNVTHAQGFYSARIEFHGRSLGEFRLQVPGRHNLKNALAAAALAHSMGVPSDAIVDALGSFAGLRRRLEQVGTGRGVSLFDDYAHHPTEVVAGLSTLREIVPSGTIWCVFQPHQASRTARLLEQFAQALCFADKVLVAGIFRAREDPSVSAEITSAHLARRIAEIGGNVDQPFGFTSRQAEHEHLADDIFEAICRGELTSGDLVVTMGAGDIGKVINDVSQRIRKNRAASYAAG